jgi:hypothetical protein
MFDKTLIATAYRYEAQRSCADSRSAGCNRGNRSALVCRFAERGTRIRRGSNAHIRDRRDHASAPDAIPIALCIARPVDTGGTRFDASTAAVGDYHLSRAGLPVPEWVQSPSKSLTDVWTVWRFTGDADATATFRIHSVNLAATELTVV